MSTSVPDFSQLSSLCKDAEFTAVADAIGREISKLMSVDLDEVALLKVERQHLRFIYPAKLMEVGTIPLTTAGSTAVRCALNRRPELSNNFAQARHASIFEAVDLGTQSKSFGDSGKAIIQKMMTVPVVVQNKSVAVLQVCRKGTSRQATGPDFSPADLRKLTDIAALVATCK